MRLKKITPILIVDQIESCLPFWIDRLGFSKTTEVPHEDKLGFVILEKDGYEVMYQTLHSVTEDVPVLNSVPASGSVLFIEVDDVAATEVALDGADIIVPRRKTFYGSDEIFAREPGGHIVGFAEFPKAD